MRNKTSKGHMNGLLALILFVLFAASILSVLMAGAGVYRRLAERDDAAYHQRTTARYLSAKVRQSAGGLSVEEFGGVDALTLREDIAGMPFVTRIYCYDGYLRELFYLEDSPLSPADGERVLPLESLSAAVEGGLLTMLVIPLEGEPERVILALRGKGGGGNEE